MKTFLKHLVIPPLATRPITTLATHLLGHHVPVFFVHKLINNKTSGYGITPGHLRNCLTYLVKNGYNFVTLKQAILALKNGTPLPNKSVAFTMDDGYLEQATISVPLFQEFDCPVTFFIITDMLDQNLWPWDAKIAWLLNKSKKQSLDIKFKDETIHLDISDYEKKHKARLEVRDFIKETEAANITDNLNCVAKAAGIPIPELTPHPYKAINWEIARELEKKGVIFAPHSKTHRVLSKMDAQSARDEIEGSWQRLKEELSEPLKIFCYPTGRIFDFGPREISILKENNFLGAVSSISGYLTSIEDSNINLFSLPRFDIPESMSDFIQYCSWIEYAKKSIRLH